MEYSQTALDSLRAALNRYKRVEKINGIERPWNRIAEDIVDEFMSASSLADDVDIIKSFAEALRRFVQRVQVPKEDRLRAIEDFLTKKKYIDRADIQRADDAERLFGALREFFTGQAAVPVSRTLRLTGTYVATHRLRNEAGRISVLTILPTSNDQTLIQESIYKVSKLPSALTPEALQKYATGHCLAQRRVTGILVPNSNGQTCMFVRDSVADASVYVLVHEELKSTDREGVGLILVLKSNDFGEDVPHLRNHVLSLVDDPVHRPRELKDLLAQNLWEYKAGAPS